MHVVNLGRPLSLQHGRKHDTTKRGIKQCQLNPPTNLCFTARTNARTDDIVLGAWCLVLSVCSSLFSWFRVVLLANMLQYLAITTAHGADESGRVCARYM
jgi:hypothetical protein